MSPMRCQVMNVAARLTVARQWPKAWRYGTSSASSSPQVTPGQRCVIDRKCDDGSSFNFEFAHFGGNSFWKKKLICNMIAAKRIIP